MPRKDKFTGFLPFDDDAGRDGHDELAEGRAGKKKPKKQQSDWDKKMRALGLAKEGDDGRAADLGPGEG